MAEQIKDGSGRGYLVKVTSDNKLVTTAETVTEEQHANDIGDAYNINTGIITLTDDVETPLLYIKNNEAQDMIILAVALGMFDSTGGTTSNMYSTFIRNPLSGTIISSTPTDVPIKSNRNYGSANTLTADCYVGATGDTMTDGDDHILVRLGPGSRSYIGINEVLTKGASFGVKLKPQTSNTSMGCYAAVICYLRTDI